MDYRHGTCTACNATFRIPASFQADKAKCSKCGGVVQIASSEPVAAARPKPVPARVPARAPAKAAPAAETHADHGKHGSKRHGAKKGGLPLPLKVTFAIAFPVLACAAWVGYQWKLDGEDALKRQEIARSEQAEIDKLNVAAKDAEAKRLIQEANDRANKTANPDGTVVSGTGAAAPAAAPKPAAKPVEGYDLATIPDFKPAEGVTAERWKELEALAATFADFDAGSAMFKAGSKLEENPKESIPVLLNQLKRQNMEDDRGWAIADSIVTKLETMCPGHMIRWRSKMTKDYIKHNQMNIKKWCDTYITASTDEAAWAKLTAKRERPQAKVDADDEFFRKK